MVYDCKEYYDNNKGMRICRCSTIISMVIFGLQDIIYQSDNLLGLSLLYILKII